MKSELKLSERTYKCETCGIELDRDINASINIRELGRTLLTY
nr:zinc ribbon domain-containing protein [uncultured Cetobacterium sp.]